VRAMHCSHEFLAGEPQHPLPLGERGRGEGAVGGQHKIDKFVVAGGSKRGWTTWCTAAVDKRVVAAIPIVIDCIHVRPSMQHHVAAYGFYAESVGDYMNHKYLQPSHDPKLIDLYAIEVSYS